jgi:hypothetical protein
MGSCCSIPLEDAKFEVTPEDIKRRVQNYLENIYGNINCNVYDIPTIYNNISTNYLVDKNEVCRLTNESIILLISKVNFLQDRNCIITYYNDLNVQLVCHIPTVRLAKGFKITLLS